MPEPGRRLSRCRLIKRIGDVGMGVVWAAERQEPVRRRVASKVIKRGMDTCQVIACFGGSAGSVRQLGVRGS